MKKKILVIPSDRTGVGYFRSVKPHVYIGEHYADEFDIDIMYLNDLPPEKSIGEVVGKYDMVHFHGTLDKECKILNAIKFLGVTTVMDIDDYWNLGDFHPLSYSSRIENWKETKLNHIRLADYVTTTTEIFAKEIAKHNKNVVVIPNAIDPNEKQFIPIDRPSDKIRFGLICGSSHEHDVKMLDGMTSLLDKETMDKCQFYLCGFDTRGSKTIIAKDGTKRVEPIDPKDGVWAGYEKILTDNYKLCGKEYADYLKTYKKEGGEAFGDEFYQRRWTKNVNEYATHYNDIDVLIVPLKDTDFNKMKSQLKVVEAGFFNKAIIASNFGPYTIDLKNAIGNGGGLEPDGNAILIDTNKKGGKAWAKAVKRIVNDPDLLLLLRRNLHETVKDTYSIDAVCKTRVEFYNEILK